jgi:SAM-dependent methyltransferase
LQGYDCVGVDLSEEMLAKARENAALTPQPPLPRGEGAKELQHSSKADSTSSTALPLSPGERGLGGEGLQPSFVKANLIDLSELLSGSFDYAACLFSTLGMVRGLENRAKVIANAFRLLKPGGRFVLHVHNRYFRGLGWKRILGQATKSIRGKAGEIAMPQAYGGAPLTLHHFTRREAVQLLEASGFAVREVLAVGVDGKTAWPCLRVYGWLILSESMK